MNRPVPRLEDKHQIAYFEWIRTQHILVGDARIALGSIAYHTPNERKEKHERQRLWRLGVLNGVSDICVPVPHEPYAGLYIELKAHKNKPTPEQDVFLSRMRFLGYDAHWCTGWDKAREITESYLGDLLDRNTKATVQ